VLSIFAFNLLVVFVLLAVTHDRAAKRAEKQRGVWLPT
jgi:hypothetical protein